MPFGLISILKDKDQLKREGVAISIIIRKKETRSEGKEHYKEELGRTLSLE